MLRFGWWSVLLAVVGCTAATPALDFGPGDGDLSITTSPSYTWDGIASSGFVAAVVNRSAETAYSRVGDGFGGPVQDLLFIAAGADASFERETTPGTWTAVAVGLLVEGARTVELRAGKSYPLSGVPVTPVDGTYRIRLRYFRNAERSGTPEEIVSSPFTIR